MKNDLISRSALTEGLKRAEAIIVPINGIKAVDISAVIEFVGKIPVVDAAEVTHCKDCRYYFNGACAHLKNRVTMKVPDFGEHYVYLGDLVVPDNHHCGYGKRRADDGTP